MRQTTYTKDDGARAITSVLAICQRAGFSVDVIDTLFCAKVQADRERLAERVEFRQPATVEVE